MSTFLSIAIFLAFGLMFVYVTLTVGRLVRPNLPTAQKKAIYECGETAIGSSWVQFDLRFYIVALFYLVFDVEVALMYPWAVAFRQLPGTAVILGLPFVAIVVIGFAYEWYSGSLDWVRSAVTTSQGSVDRGGVMAELARRDPEAMPETMGGGDPAPVAK